MELLPHIIELCNAAKEGQQIVISPYEMELLKLEIAVALRKEAGGGSIAPQDDCTMVRYMNGVEIVCHDFCPQGKIYLLNAGQIPSIVLPLP